MYKAPVTAVKMGLGCSFGTFGEILQGMLPTNNEFLVTFPIEKHSWVTFHTNHNDNCLSVFPQEKHKAKRLCEYLLEHFNLPIKGSLFIESDIPVGKGLASSSADLVATCYAVADYYNLDIPRTLLQEFMRRIEPSDGVMYPGVVSFYHREVRLRECLGWLPGISVVALDEGGTVDTIEFNKSEKLYSEGDKEEYAELLGTVSKAVRLNDVHTIGRVSTRSAIMNQRLQPKRSLSDVLDICEEVGGLGVIVAHSGTYIGILIAHSDSAHQLKIQRATASLHRITSRVNVFCSGNPGV